MKRTASRTTKVTSRPDPLIRSDEDNDHVGPQRSKRVRRGTSNFDDIKIQQLEPQLSHPAVRQGASESGDSIQQTPQTPHPAPPRWRQQYDLIVAMRSQETADVDTMGCQLAQAGETDPVARRVSTIVSLMLSTQTKDTVCHAAVIRLRAAVGGSLTVAAILAADKSTISEAICKVSFWNKKTDYLIKTAQILGDDYDSDVPKTFDELCGLPGVGVKVASLTLSMAWNIYENIGVDVHVNRITNRLGWNRPATWNKGQEIQTKRNLESWLPRELWYDINHKFVGFGQTICRPTNPHCNRCDLRTADLCPSANSSNIKKGHQTVGKGSAKPKIEIALDE